MFKKNLISLLLLLITSLLFNQVKAISSPVFRLPVSLDESPHPNLDSPEDLPPNAKLIAAGLPPLPPFRRWAPTETEDIVKRHESSAVIISGKIRVDNAYGVRLGYLSQTLGAGHYTMSIGSNVGRFSISAKPNGKTSNLNIRHTNDLFLAGIVRRGVSLSSTSNTYAQFGDSQSTPANSPPQSNTSPTLSGDSETAIWTYTANTGSIQAKWVNYDKSSPKTYIMYDTISNTFYLTARPDAVKAKFYSAQVVTFAFVV